MDGINVGALDMFGRFLLAMLFFTLATFLQGDWRWLALLGFVPLFTAVFRHCPLYAALGWSTCNEEPEKHHLRAAH
jgi:hypothetical protein